MACSTSLVDTFSEVAAASARMRFASGSVIVAELDPRVGTTLQGRYRIVSRIALATAAAVGAWLVL